MSSNQGRFIWYELATTDVKAAIDFYKKVLGWETELYEGAGSPYHVLKAGGTGIGGARLLPDEATKNGAPPHWIGYVFADDVDALTKKAASLGGSSCVPPTDIPTVGRFSVIGDPSGAMIALLKPIGPDSEEPAEAPEKHFCWRELISGNHEEAIRFYSELFGWQKTDRFDGPMGVYQMYGRGGRTLGGMMTKPAEYPHRPHWLYYVRVADLDAAIEKTRQNGGRIMMGPVPVPDGTRIAQCVDPQGAMFAMNGN
jgi:hypothetical protein